MMFTRETDVEPQLSDSRVTVAIIGYEIYKGIDCTDRPRCFG